MSRRRKILLAIISLLFLSILYGEGFLYNDMFPFQPASSEDFWAAATTVRLRGSEENFGTARLDRGYFIFQIEGMDGLFYSRVPQATALLDFPDVLAELTVRAAANNPNDSAAEGFREWSTITDPTQKTPEALINAIEHAKAVRLVGIKPSYALYAASRQIELQSRIEKSHFFWATAAFEIFFLTAFVLWLAYPLWRTPRLHRFLLCWCSAPFIFLLPHWLGFSQYVDMHIWPTGGILYPHLLLCAGPPTEPALREIHFLQCLPHFLEPISQDAGGYIFTDFDGIIFRGPICAMYHSLAIAFIIIVIYAILAIIPKRQSRQRGFEILPAKTDFSQQSINNSSSSS